ncbi:NAD-glutamate dehydrogenase, partial [Saccharopolyspora sp. NPDC003762]
MTSNPGQLKTGERPRVAGDDAVGERSENPELAKRRLLDRAVESAPELAELLRAYYRHVPAEELVDDEPADLVGALRSHHRLAAERVAGRPLVQIFNPDRAEDGWGSQATVVQTVTDDMPYLVDSVIAELGRYGAEVQRIIHPIVVVRRDVAGELLEVLPGADPAAPPADAMAESWMFVEVDRVVDTDRIADLKQGLANVLNDVREVVEDTERMHATARSLADELDRTPPPLPGADVHDGAELLRWLADGHFTFLGYRHYELVDDGTEPALQAVLASGLGVLRSDSVAARSLTAGPDARASALSKDLLVLTQASAPSTVHRPVHPFYVGVKTFDEAGNV